MSYRDWIALTVSFMTDFMGGLMTALGGGVALDASTGGSGVPSLPPRAVWVVAVLGGLYAGFRGLQKNLSAPLVAAAPVVADAPKPRLSGGA